MCLFLTLLNRYCRKLFGDLLLFLLGDMGPKLIYFLIDLINLRDFLLNFYSFSECVSYLLLSIAPAFAPVYDLAWTFDIIISLVSVIISL